MSKKTKKRTRKQPNSSGARAKTGKRGKPRPTSTAARGKATRAGTGGREVTVPRVLRVQLTGLDKDAWSELRQLACESARFCNAKLADLYCGALKYRPPKDAKGNDWSVERRAAGRLSGDAYVALAREAMTAWQRHAKLILAGAQRLALFQADRALVCRGEYRSKGERKRCSLLIRDGDGYRLNCRLVKAVNGPRHDFRLWWKPQLDGYVTPVLDAIAAGDTRMLKVSIVFERPGQKVFALLCYEKTVEVRSFGEKHATLGPLESDGTLWLRIDPEHSAPILHNYTGRVMRLVEMKEDFAGIHRRLRARTRRSGKGHRQAYRRALVRAGSFGAWVQGPLHEWSHDIIERCKRHGVGHLAIGPLTHQGLPMAALEERIKYKAEEAGIELSRFDVKEKTTDQAVKRPREKQRRGLAAQKKALSVLRDGLQERTVS